MSENKMESVEKAGEAGAAEENVKDRIERCAVRLFCEKGYEATAVREIVEAAGVTKPVLYYYFKNKEDLFRQIIESAVGFFKVNLEAICSEPNPDYRRQLLAIADLYLEFGESYPARARFLHAIAFSGLYDEVFNFTEFWISIFQNVTAFFARGQKAGFFQEDLCSTEIAQHFIGTAESAMRSIIYCPETLENPPSSERIVEMVLRGIGAVGKESVR